MFRRRAIAEPMRQRNAAGVLRGQTCHIEHHGAKATALQQQVCHLQRLFNTRPGRKKRSRWSVLCRSYRPAKLWSSRAPSGILSRFLRPEETFESTSHALRFLARMCTATATMQALDRFRTHQTALRKFKSDRRGMDTFAEHAAADPKQIRQSDPCSSRALRLEHVAHIDPGTDLSGGSELSDRRKSQRRSPGTLRPDDLCQSAYRQPAFQQHIHRINAGGCCRTDNTRARRQGRRHAVCEGAFDLNPKTGG